MLKSKQRKGGYIAPYSSSPNSSEYMLNSTVNNDAIANINYANNKASSPEIYVPSTASPIIASQNTPGIKGGLSKKLCNDKYNCNDRIELENGFLYSIDGGCACNSGGGSQCKKGGDFVLTPFISALALLGARMLADKNSGFNLGELFGEKDDEVKGGANNKYRAGASSRTRSARMSSSKQEDDFFRGGAKSRKYRAGASSCARSVNYY
jgi:hypothetical protein